MNVNVGLSRLFFVLVVSAAAAVVVVVVVVYGMSIRGASIACGIVISR